MADDAADDRGAQAGGDPDGGATDAGTDAAAQSADGGTAAAPADAGTTEAPVLDLGGSAEPKGDAGADDETARLRDKLGHVQPAHDAMATSLKHIQKLHPEYFDDQGKYVGEQPAAAAAGEDGVLQLGGPAADAGQADAEPEAGAGRRDGIAPLRYDGAQAGWEKLDTDAYRAIAEDQNVVGPVVGIIDAYFRSQGVDISKLAQAGRGGMTPEQMQEMIATGARREVIAYDQEVTGFDDRVAAMSDHYGAEFLGQAVKFTDGPKTTLEKALGRLCQETGESDPFFAVLKHPLCGPAARAALFAQHDAAVAAEALRTGSGRQLMPGGGGLPVGAPPKDDFKEFGGGHAPLER
jgi:hypothetical protein